MAESAKTGSQAFGDLLRSGREKLGMSRRDLAEATDLSYPYISQLETGYRQPSADAIRNLAGVLNISLDDMFEAMEKGRTPDAGSSSSAPRRSSAVGSVKSRLTEPFASHRSATLFSPIERELDNSEPSFNAGLRGSEPAELSFGAVEADPAAIDRIVYQVIGMLSTLPPEQRLDAVAELQAKVVQSVIDDGIRRGR